MLSPINVRLAAFVQMAAAPTFALMALVTVAVGGGEANALCSGAHASPLSGMTLMYLLMSAFHSVPWLRVRT